MRLALVLTLCAFLACAGSQALQAAPRQDDAASPAQSVDKTPQDKSGKPEISEKTVTELRIIPFQKIQKPDGTMPRGMVKVVQPGRQGRELVTYLVRMTDGRTIERTVVGTEVLSKPTPHIELVGTAPVVSERTLTEIQAIPFQKEQRPDDTLPSGTIRVLQEGRDGQEKITFRVKTVYGKEAERVVVNAEILSMPVSRIEAVGTGKPVQEPSGALLPGPPKEEK